MSLEIGRWGSATSSLLKVEVNHGLSAEVSRLIGCCLKRDQVGANLVRMQPDRKSLSRSNSGGYEFDLTEGYFQIIGAHETGGRRGDYLIRVHGDEVEEVNEELDELLKTLYPEEHAELTRLLPTRIERRQQWPLLLGSYKQVGWANDIRDRFADRNPDDQRLVDWKSSENWIDARKSLLPLVQLDEPITFSYLQALDPKPATEPEPVPVAEPVPEAQPVEPKKAKKADSTGRRRGRPNLSEESGTTKITTSLTEKHRAKLVHLAKLHDCGYGKIFRMMLDRLVPDDDMPK